VLRSRPGIGPGSGKQVSTTGLVYTDRKQSQSGFPKGIPAVVDGAFAWVDFKFCLIDS